MDRGGHLARHAASKSESQPTPAQEPEGGQTGGLGAAHEAGPRWALDRGRWGEGPAP